MPSRFDSHKKWAGFASIVFLVIAMACTREVEVVRTVLVPGATVEVVRTVLVPGETVEVVRTVIVPGETVEIIRTVEVPGEIRTITETIEVVRTVEVLVTPVPVEEPVAMAGPPIYQVGMFEEPITRNYWNYQGGPGASVWTAYVTDGIATTLYNFSDQRFDWVPVLADGFPTALAIENVGGTDFWTSEIKIKQGVNWSDGTEITADDFVFVVDTVLELELGGNFGSNIDPAFVDHVEALDSHTVKVFFKTTNADGDPQTPGLSVWQFGLGFAPILAKHFWEPIVEQAKIEGGDDVVAVQEALFAVSPEGEPTAGGFEFAKWEPGAFFENTTDPNFYRMGVEVIEYANGAYREIDPNRGTDVTYYGDATGETILEYVVGPHMESEIFSIYQNQDSAILALTAGDIDYLFNPLGLEKGFQDRIKSEPSLDLVSNPNNGVRYMGFNMRKAPMNIPEFRQALATVIDKDFITGTILQGSAFTVDAMVPVGNGFWHNAGVKKWGRDDEGNSLSRADRITEAVALLKSAGFTYEIEPVVSEDGRFVEQPGKGLMMPDGTEVPTLELLSPSAGYDPLRSTFAIWIERWANDIGIPIRAKLTGFNVIVDVLFGETVAEDLDLWILGWSLTLFPDYLENFFNSRHAPENEEGGLNWGGYSNPEFDVLSNELLNQTDLNAARDSVFRLQDFLATDLPYVTLFTTPILDSFRPTRVEFPYTQTLGGLTTLVNGLQQEVLIK